MNLYLVRIRIKTIIYIILILASQAVSAQAEQISEYAYKVTPLHVERTCNPGGGYPTNGAKLLGLVNGKLYEFFFGTGKVTGRKFREVIEMAQVLEGAINGKEQITIVLAYQIEKLVPHGDDKIHRIFDPKLFVSVSAYGVVWRPDNEPDPGYVGDFCR